MLPDMAAYIIFRHRALCSCVDTGKNPASIENLSEPGAMVAHDAVSRCSHARVYMDEREDRETLK